VVLNAVPMPVGGADKGLRTERCESAHSTHARARTARGGQQRNRPGGTARVAGGGVGVKGRAV
jgi:hypothetical protein